jgi:hypothetical protein
MTTRRTILTLALCLAPLAIAGAQPRPRLLYDRAHGENEPTPPMVPYSGGRAVEGGTPFAFQLDTDGKPAQPFAASKQLERGGRIVVMGEGMASLLLGVPEGSAADRGTPRRAEHGGKDSGLFMKEVLGWLARR